MTIATSGAISMLDIVTEFDLSTNQPFTAGVAEGAANQYRITATGSYANYYTNVFQSFIGYTVRVPDGRTGVIVDTNRTISGSPGAVTSYSHLISLTGGAPGAGSYFITAPKSISSFYAGGSYVPSGTIGYPNGVATYIPSSGSISIANFYGSARRYSSSIYLPAIFNVSGGLADDQDFGGDIPRTFAWTTRYSNIYTSFSVPSGFGSASIDINSWSVQLAASYSWYDPGWFSSTRYYYDYQRNFGVVIFNETDGVQVGTVLNTTNQNQWTGTFNTYTVPAGSVALTPGKNYRAYLICDFYRASDPGYGNNSFGWYNNSYPFATITAS